MERCIVFTYNANKYRILKNKNYGREGSSRGRDKSG